MKKLLTMIGAITLTATTTATIVSCGTKEDDYKTENSGLSVKELFDKYVKNAKQIQEYEKLENGVGEVLADYMNLYINNYEIEALLLNDNKAIKTTLSEDYVPLSYELIEFNMDTDFANWKAEKLGDEMFRTLTMIFVWSKNIDGYEQAKDENYQEIPKETSDGANYLSKVYEKLGFDFLQLGKEAIDAVNE